ncbi:MAG TPA: hypothetical protein VGR56_07200 [Nitrososphaerales archaeon]|nr:hypothetical protein [Nitrososphaerales archaeon]
MSPANPGLLARILPIWAVWLRLLTVGAYVLLAIYVFVRPTAAEYVRTNGVTFTKDWADKGWGVFFDIGRAILDHIFSLPWTTFFSFVLLSLGFALTFYLFHDIDRLAKEGLPGYFQMALISLFATLVILSSVIASSTTTGPDRVNYALGLLATAGTLVVMLYARSKFPVKDILRKE